MMMKKLLVFPALNVNAPLRFFQNVDPILEDAKKFEKAGMLKDAEILYKKIIFDLNPKEKRAYDALVQLWGRSSVFGFTQERVDSLLEQYKKNFPLPDSESPLSNSPKSPET